MHMDLDYIKHDNEGFAYNGMFPPAGAPDATCWQEKYSGYKNGGEEAFFYNYAVQGYNIDFNYNGKHYALMGWMDGVPIALLDADDNELQRFEDPMDAVLHCTIEGHRLLDILEEITDMECG